MTYNKKRHIELVKYAQDLKDQKKNIFIENQKACEELLNYNIAVEEQVFWSYKEEIFLLMKNFIHNKIHFDEFEIAFTLLYKKIRKEFNLFVMDLKKIEKFQPSTRSDRFASLINSIFRQFEEVDEGYCTKQEVQNYVTKGYLEFQKFLTEKE